jgi:hypothetical protein
VVVRVIIGRDRPRPLGLDIDIVLISLVDVLLISIAQKREGGELCTVSQSLDDATEKLTAVFAYEGMQATE